MDTFVGDDGYGLSGYTALESVEVLGRGRVWRGEFRGSIGLSFCIHGNVEDRWMERGVFLGVLGHPWELFMMFFVVEVGITTLRVMIFLILGGKEGDDSCESEDD